MSRCMLSCLLALTIAAPTAHAAPAAKATATPAAAPVAAPAVNWTDTFPPGAIGTYLGDNKPNVMVIGATAASEEAAVALRAAMRASKMAGLVIDAQAIGATEGLDDKTIVDRAKTQPVAQVVIVRVFEGGPGEPPSTIVTFYRLDGTVATAITGTAGTPVDATGGVTAGSGVSNAAADAVSKVGDDAEKEAEKEKTVDSDAQAKYDAQYLWVQNWVGVSAQTGAVVASWSAIKQGKFGADVKGADLYRIVGRDDLYRKYKRRQAIRIGVGLPAMFGGIALLSAGLGVAVGNISADPPDFGSNDPIMMGASEAPTRVSNNGAFAMMGVGGGLFVAGLLFIGLFRPHPADRAQAAQMIDEYNRDLRKKLGLRKAEARVRVTPSLGLQHTGLSVSGRF